jgi:low affinity Fe/Cu permease
MYRKTLFSRIATSVAQHVGHPASFALALLAIVAWASLGPFFGFSDTWQLVVNTATTIVTFLMVFLIQNTQNRDAHAMHVKLDELIRAMEGAHNALLDLEELNDNDLDTIRRRYVKLACEAREALRRGSPDTDPVEVGER